MIYKTGIVSFNVTFLRFRTSMPLLVTLYEIAPVSGSGDAWFEHHEESIFFTLFSTGWFQERIRV